MKTASLIFNFYMHSLTFTSLVDTIRGNNRQWNEFIVSEKYLYIEKILIRIILIVFAVNTLIISLFIKNLFSDIAEAHVAQASYEVPIIYHNDKELPPSESIANFISHLKNNGHSINLNQKVIRPLFVVDGRIITMELDSFEVFEYIDAETAQKHFVEIAQKYTDSEWPDIYKKQIHLYTIDSLGIYYLGNNEEIIETLENKSDTIFGIDTNK